MSCMWVNFPVERTLLITIKSDEGDLSLKSHVIIIVYMVAAAVHVKIK